MEHQQGQLTLEIGGQKRTLFFDYTFVSILQSRVADGDVEGFLQTNPILSIPYIAYAALQAGDDVNDLPEGLTERMVGRWLSQLTPQENAQVLESYKTAMGFIGAVFTGVTNAVSAVEKGKPTKSAKG